jgi:hypothetical protein
LLTLLHVRQQEVNVRSKVRLHREIRLNTLIRLPPSFRAGIPRRIWLPLLGALDHPTAAGMERVEFVAAVVDEAVAGVGHLVPGAGEVAGRLGHDQPGLLGDLVQDGEPE